MMNAYEIKSSKSDYPYLVIASEMTKAIDVFCRITEETEDVIERIKVLPYPTHHVFVPTMLDSNIHTSDKK